MSDKEIKELIALANKNRRNLTKEKAMNSLISAGIIDKKGVFTKPYTRLSSFVTEKTK